MTDTPITDGTDSSCGDESGIHDRCIVERSRLERELATEISKNWCPHMTDPEGAKITCGEYIAAAREEAYRWVEAEVKRGDEWKYRAEAAEAKLAQVEALLAVAVCPACDGSGGIPHQISDDEWEQQQCQWCFERSALAPDRTAATQETGTVRPVLVSEQLTTAPASAAAATGERSES